MGVVAQVAGLADCVIDAVLYFCTIFLFIKLLNDQLLDLEASRTLTYNLMCGKCIFGASLKTV